MPAIEPGATLRLSAQDLIAAIKNLINAPIDLNPKYTAALRQLADIFKDTVVEKDETTEEQSVPRVNNTPVQRVNTPSTSHNPTAPRVLRAKPRKKKKRTIAEYQRQRQAIEKATPTRLPHESNPPPNYISQDEEEDQPAYTGLMKATQSPQIYSTTNPCNIKSAALYNLMGKHLESEYSNAYMPQKFNNSPFFSSEIALDHVANGVVHPVTKETITKYEKLANDPLLSDVWCKAMCKELGRLAQGYNGTNGTTLYFS
eukprot:scaffold248342_cov55-Cyclotella_meneghiniana.AAC.1